MQSIIQKNYKKLGLITIGVILLAIFIFSDDILATILPNASELEMISCELSVSEFEYTGSEMKPEVKEVTFQDQKGNKIVKTSEEIEIVSYQKNVNFGKGDIEVKIKGYISTNVLEDVFQIIPANVKELKVAQVSEEAIQLTWEEVPGADGYHIYRKEVSENEFILICDTLDGKTTVYQDVNVTFNKIYQYKVCAFGLVKEEIPSEDTTKTDALKADITKADNIEADVTEDKTTEAEEMLLGEESNQVICYTPLTTPVISSIENQTYNSILVQWEAVEGAIGYQVYRSASSKGEYSMIGEITEGTVLSYTDSTCECGKEYFYYVKACQKLETENVYGKASNTVSAKTTPDQTKISGKVTNSDTQVNLSWKQSNGAQGYEIYRKAGSSDYKLIKKIESASTLSWADSGLNKEKDYSYKIRPYCVVNGTTVSGSYSNTYTKKAVVAENKEEESGNTSGNTSSSGNSSAAGSISGVTKYVGTSYVLGGNTPDGWDCSGFTQWALKKYYGVSIPRTAASQGTGGKSVSVSNRSAWQPGDIVAFSNGSRISHVGLYLGNGQMMHALNTKYDTIIQSVDYYESWDSANYLAAVRRYH